MRIFKVSGLTCLFLLLLLLSACGADTATVPVVPTPTIAPSPTSYAAVPTATAKPQPTSTPVPTATPVPATTKPLPTATPQPTTAKPQAAPGIEIPAANAKVTVPLHLLARLGEPGEELTVSLKWQSGLELKRPMAVIKGENGKGLLIGNLDWGPIPQVPEPATQPATLEIRNAAGKTLAQQSLTVLSPKDPATQEIKLYWVVNEEVQAVPRSIPRSEKVRSAALEELLWGPPFPTNISFTTALPTPQQVLSFPGKESDWGPRITLRKLTIENGVAVADFSQEFRAYGGGSLKVKLIYQQISQTLKQFPTVQEVRILVEGQSEGVLEP